VAAGIPAKIIPKQKIIGGVNLKAYDIKIYPDPILTLKAEKVEKFDEELQIIIDNMCLTMQIAGGVGLAAPQVGLLKRIAIVSRDDQQYILINPELIECSGNETKEEGCLSFPGMFAQVARPNKVKIKTNNAKGDVNFLEVEGNIARVFLHEMEHLDGKLFIDHLSPLKRGVIKKKMKKEQARRNEAKE
jgi:peptide deformylase